MKRELFLYQWWISCDVLLYHIAASDALSFVFTYANDEPEPSLYHEVVLDAGFFLYNLTIILLL